jgi:hypothetical protein
VEDYFVVFDRTANHEMMASWGCTRAQNFQLPASSLEFAAASHKDLISALLNSPKYIPFKPLALDMLFFFSN